MEESSRNDSTYSSIDIARFKQTIIENAIGLSSLGRSQISPRRRCQFVAQKSMNNHESLKSPLQNLQEYEKYSNASVSKFHGYISDTPPNTPSSGGSDPQSILKTDPKMLTDTIRREARKPNGGSLLAKDSGLESEEDDINVKFNENGTDNFWIGQRLSEKKDLSVKTPALRNFWEENSQREQQDKLKQEAMAQPKRRAFGFPKWRSNDPMTASLVASGKVTTLIPKDSQIPEHRRQKIEETERKAEMERQQIQQMVRKPLQKGKSLESLSMQVNQQQWYDREKIKESISRESIANIGAVREKFERGFEFTSRNDLNRMFATDYTPVRSTSITPALRESSRQSTAKPSTPVPVHHDPPPYQSMNGHHEPNHGYHQSVQPSHHGSNSTVNLSPDHYLLLQYIKQNPGIFGDFGIEIPKQLLTLADEVPFPNENNHHLINRHQNQTPIQLVPPTPQKGRYVKNPGNNGQSRFRRTYDMSLKQMPENRRQSMQELDQIKAGDGLISAEIRAMKEREEELRRSRSELGLPNLEDTLEMWKHGYQARMNYSKGMRTASSFDHLQHGSCDELRTEEDHATAFEQQFHETSHGQPYHPEPFQQQSEQFEQQQQHFTRMRPSSTYGSTTGGHYTSDEPLIIGATNPTKNRSGSSETGPTSGIYRLHKSQDPDVMIYGPSAHRKTDTPTVKLTESPVLGQSTNRPRNIRYE